MGARKSRRIIVSLLAALLTVTTVAAPAAGRTESRGAGGGATTMLRGASPKPFLNAVAPGTLGVKSDLGYQGGGYDWVIGEVWNRTTARRQLILVTATFLDADDNVLGVSEEYIFLQHLAPGMTSPFFVEFEDTLEEAAAYILSINPGTASATQPVGGLEVTQGTTTSASGMVTYNGTVHNPNNFAVELADANVTLYNAAGEAIDVWWAYTTPDTIPAHGTGTYAVDFFEPAPGVGPVTKVAVVSQAWRSGTSSYVTSWENYFDDIGTSTFRNDIIWLAASGITAGCSAGKYCPTRDVRRDEMASFLSRALGLVGSPPDAFTDDNGNTHEQNINRLFAAGITTGCGPGLYCPASSVARDQMASFLSRALGLTGTPPDAFTDDNGNTHEQNINRIFAAGITTGCGGSNYCPKANVTRGQMAAFLRRSFED